MRRAKVVIIGALAALAAAGSLAQADPGRLLRKLQGMRRGARAVEVAGVEPRHDPASGRVVGTRIGYGLRVSRALLHEAKLAARAAFPGGRLQLGDATGAQQTELTAEGDVLVGVTPAIGSRFRPFNAVVEVREDGSGVTGRVRRQSGAERRAAPRKSLGSWLRSLKDRFLASLAP